MAEGQVKQKQETIKQEVFEGLCKIQCTRDEICSVLNVSKDTLIRWCKNTYGEDFETVFAVKRLGGFASLRRMQWARAESGSDTMLIWLGKQILGQRDKIEETNDEALNKLDEILESVKQNAILDQTK